jgi:hypothetical protein
LPSLFFGTLKTLKNENFNMYTVQYVFFSVEQNLKCPGEFSLNYRRFSRIFEILFDNKKNTYCRLALNRGTDCPEVPRFFGKYYGRLATLGKFTSNYIMLFLSQIYHIISRQMSAILLQLIYASKFLNYIFISCA